jgi:hypothetical protein
MYDIFKLFQRLYLAFEIPMNYCSWYLHSAASDDDDLLAGRKAHGITEKQLQTAMK